MLLNIDPRTWQWDLLAVFGFGAQALFASRFIVQWIASERRRVSHMPVQFWYLSLAGGMMMLAYGVGRRDPVIILGQAPGLIVYVRNLMLIRRESRGGVPPGESERESVAVQKAE